MHCDTCTYNGYDNCVAPVIHSAPAPKPSPTPEQRGVHARDEAAVWCGTPANIISSKDLTTSWFETTCIKCLRAGEADEVMRNAARKQLKKLGYAINEAKAPEHI